jgi:hypothetical protein
MIFAMPFSLIYPPLSYANGKRSAISFMNQNNWWHYSSKSIVTDPIEKALVFADN